MTIRSINGAASVATLAAMLALGAGTPVIAQVQGQVQAVPRAGVSFANTVTARAWVESIDTDTRTIAFSTSDGRLVNVAIGDSVRNLDQIPEEAMAMITYNEVVTLLNLRQKGPGSHEARREGSSPYAADNDIGRFTMTVTAIDLATNRVSLIDGRGGPVHTYAATSIAKQDQLKKIKVGDVVIGITTPLLVTALAPAPAK
jgi:hypothetical protein